jgi:hypothetical protein
MMTTAMQLTFWDGAASDAGLNDEEARVVKPSLL